MRSRWHLWAVVSLSLLLAATPQVPQGDLPHVSECNYCQKCSTDTDNSLSSSRPPGAADAASYSPQLLQEEPETSGIFPTRRDIAAKQLKPNCSECRGCSTQLQALKAVTAFGQDFQVEVGASPEWLFTADLPQHMGAGKAVVKVWCMPLSKVANHPAGQFSWRCKKSRFPVSATQFLLAQDKVLAECGLQDVTIKVWVAPVNGVEPTTGLHIWWYGLWMTRAPGISLNQLSYVTRPAFLQDTILDLLETKLNKSRVVRAAMLDLLTSQCDRHSQNVFIDDQGQITLIDNMQAMRFSWHKCGSDSLFLPGTQKNEVVRFGNVLVRKTRAARRRLSLNPMILLDYRCYVAAGRIGTDYPPQLKQCLQTLASMSASELMHKYKFPLLRNAEVLHSRATDMLERGFEWALQRGEPTNPAPMRYKWHQPCCKLKIVPRSGLACAHDWNVTAEFPLGDPVKGGDWKLSYLDPGTFQGGSQWS